MNAPGDDTRATLDTYARRSYAGEVTFPEFVGAFSGVGVESYQVDYRRGEMRCYFTDGGSHLIASMSPQPEVADAFDAGAVQAAIRASQKGEIRYPEFVSRTVAAGCAGYTVWIKGRHVCYFGRRGETHIEHFPGT